MKEKEKKLHVATMQRNINKLPLLNKFHLAVSSILQQILYMYLINTFIKKLS